MAVAPSATFDWESLKFDLYPTNGYIEYTCTNGTWDQGKIVNDPYVKLHIASVALNYGQSTFEGIKAFRSADGHVRIFRPQENAKRMQYSSDIISLPELPEELFLEACERAVALNLEFVPPYGRNATKGAMYLRPLYFGSGPNLALNTPSIVTFIVYVTPVGSLYGAAGIAAPAVDAFVIEDFDRSAPKGTGAAKLAGNYAPVFKHTALAKQSGYGITLHLDSKTRTMVDEFSTSNCLFIKTPATESGKPTLVVPESSSILKSVTTKSVIDIWTKTFGFPVEQRHVQFQEVLDGVFGECAAAGTAAAITPVRTISYTTEGGLQKVSIGDGVNAGVFFLQILAELTGVQSGDREPPSKDWLYPPQGVLRKD